MHAAYNELEENGSTQSDQISRKKRRYRRRREERYKFTDSSDEEYKPCRSTSSKMSEHNFRGQRRISDQISSSVNKIHVFKVENNNQDLSNTRNFHKKVEGQCCCAVGGDRCQGIPGIVNRKTSTKTQVSRTSRQEDEVTVTKVEPPTTYATPINNVESTSSCDCQVCRCSVEENSVYRASKRQESVTIKDVESPVARSTIITSTCDCQKCECSDECEVITKDTCLICQGNCECIECNCSKDGRDSHYSSCDCSPCRCSESSRQSSQASFVHSTDRECDPCDCVECTCTEGNYPTEEKYHETDTSNWNSLQNSVNRREVEVSDTSDQDDFEIYPVDECSCVTCDCYTDDHQSDVTSFDTNYESSNKSIDNGSSRKKSREDSYGSHSRNNSEDIRRVIREKDRGSCEFVCCHKEPVDGALKSVCPCYDLNEKYNEELTKNERPGCCRRFFSCCFGSKKDKAKAKPDKTKDQTKPEKEKPVKNMSSRQKPGKEKPVKNMTSRQKPKKVKVVEKQKEEQGCCSCCSGSKPKKEETYQRKTSVKENVCRRRASQKNGEYKECPRGHVKALPDPKPKSIRKSSTQRDGSTREYDKNRNESTRSRETTNHRDEKKSSGCCGCCGGNKSQSKKANHEKSKQKKEMKSKKNGEQETRNVGYGEVDGRETEWRSPSLGKDKPTRSCCCSGGQNKPPKKKSREDCHCMRSKFRSQYKSRSISEKVDNKNGLTSRTEQIAYSRCQQKVFPKPYFQVLKSPHTHRGIQTEPMQRYDNNTSLATTVQEREVMQVNLDEYLPAYDKLTRSRYNTLRTLIETSAQVVTGNTRRSIVRESCVKSACSKDDKPPKYSANGTKENTRSRVKWSSQKRHNREKKHNSKDRTDQRDGQRNVGENYSKSVEKEVKIQQEHICRKMLNEKIKLKEEERKNVLINSSTRFISDSLACSSAQVPIEKRANPNTNIQIEKLKDGINQHQFDINPTQLESEMTVDHSYVTLITGTTLPQLGKSSDQKDRNKKKSQGDDLEGSVTTCIAREPSTSKEYSGDIEPKKNECIKISEFYDPRPRVTDAYMNTINLGVEKSVQTESKMINEDDTSLTTTMFHRPLLHLRPASEDVVMYTALKCKPLPEDVYTNAFYMFVDKDTQTEETCNNGVTSLREKSNEKDESGKRGKLFVDAGEEVIDYNTNHISRIEGEYITDVKDSVRVNSNNAERKEKECGDGNNSNLSWNTNPSAHAFAERGRPGHNEHCTNSPRSCNQSVIEQRSATDSSVSKKTVGDKNISSHIGGDESSCRKTLSTTVFKKTNENQNDDGNINDDNSLVSGTRIRCRSHKSFREFRHNNKMTSPHRRKTSELDASKKQDTRDNAEESGETSEEITESQPRRRTRDEVRTEHRRKESVVKLKKSMSNSRSQSEMNSFQKLAEPLKRMCSNVFHAAGISSEALGTRSWSNVMKEPFYSSEVSDRKSKQAVRKKSSNEYHHRDIRNRMTWEDIRDEHEKKEKEKERKTFRVKRKSSVGMPNQPRRYTWEDVKRDHCEGGYSKNKTTAASTVKPKVTSIKREHSR